jgi:putative intracellular protease/amidase
MNPIKILVVATSHSELGHTGRKTGLWLHELAIPYYIFKEAGAEITLVSPIGGRVPLDPKSESIIAANSSTKRFLKDPEAISLLQNSAPLSSQTAKHFDIIFLLGGHGAMWDFPGNGTLTKLVEDFNTDNKFIAAVCHGVAGLLSPLDITGEPLVKNKLITGFSNSEEQASGIVEILPFLIESSSTALGANYSKAPDHLSHVVRDRNIITGQNPASSIEIASKLIYCMQKSIGESTLSFPL